MTNGRSIFLYYRILIDLFCLLFGVLPGFVKRFIFDVFSIFSGKVALLVRYAFLRSYSKEVGKNVYVGRFVVLKGLRAFVVGENVSIHDSCYIDAVGGVEIGSNVSIAHQSSLITFNHCWNNFDVPIKYNSIELGAIVIENDVWVGCGVRIMPNVRIGSRSVVAAGSVVTEDVPPGVIVGGVPARIIKKIA